MLGSTTSSDSLIANITFKALATSGSTGLTLNNANAAYDTYTNPSVTNGTVSFSSTATPSTPTSFSYTGLTPNSVTLTWSASTDTGGPGIGGYYIYRSLNGGSYTKLTSVSSSTLSYTDPTVVYGSGSGNSYGYYVESYDTNSTPNTSSPTSDQSLNPPYITGSLDDTTSVEGHDLSILLSHYGSNYPAAQFDGGSVVEGHDLSILLSNYGK
jgi:hypothetical protein